METLNSNQTIRQVVTLLKLTFGIVPIVAGLDKFTNILTQWDNYLHPDISGILPFDPHVFMMIVGIIEITAGIIVFVKPDLGGFIVSAWLALIALSLLASGNYIDVAIRDLVMAISAFSMARLANLSDK